MNDSYILKLNKTGEKVRLKTKKKRKREMPKPKRKRENEILNTKGEGNREKFFHFPSKREGN